MPMIDRDKPVWRVVGRIADGRRCTTWVNADGEEKALEVAAAESKLVSTESVKLITPERMMELDAMAAQIREVNTGRSAARMLLINHVIRTARDLREASRNCFEDEPEAGEAWDALNEALTALDDWATASLEQDS